MSFSGYFSSEIVTTTAGPWDPDKDYRLTMTNFALLLFTTCATVFVFMLICLRKMLDFFDNYDLEDLQDELKSSAKWEKKWGAPASYDKESVSGKVKREFNSSYTGRFRAPTLTKEQAAKAYEFGKSIPTRLRMTSPSKSKREKDMI